MWIAISIILLNIIATVLINATLITSFSLTTLVMSAIMYVDGTDIMITAKEGETIQQLKENAQTLIKNGSQLCGSVADVSALTNAGGT